MHNEKEDIDQLFSKKFEKFEVKSSEDEWSKLNQKLSKVNFLKFSFVTFNIYYLMLLTAFAGTATFNEIRNIQLSRKIQILEHASQIYRAKNLQKIDAIGLNTTAIPKAIPDINKSNGNGNVKPKIKKISVSETKEPDQPAIVNDVPFDKSLPDIKEEDKSSVEKSVPNDTTKRIPVRKVVRKTYVLKPHPVIKKDTVEITKFKK